MGGGNPLRFDVQTDWSALDLCSIPPAGRGKLCRVAYDGGEIDGLAILLDRRTGENEKSLDRFAAVKGGLGRSGEQVMQLVELRWIVLERLPRQVAVTCHQHE